MEKIIIRKIKLLLTHLPKHIYDWYIEVWGQLDVALSTEFRFRWSINWLIDWNSNLIITLIEFKFIDKWNNHLKHFSIISITSKWIDSSRLFFPRPKFFKVFRENLNTFIHLQFEINIIMIYIIIIIISKEYLRWALHSFPVLFKIPKAPLLNLNGTIQSGACILTIFGLTKNMKI